MHALFAYYFLGVKRTTIARLFSKSISTIANWVQQYESTSSHQRKQSSTLRKFTDAEKHWVVQFYHNNPIAFLDEAKKSFEIHFKKRISVSTIWRIIHDYGYTWKVLERRAMQVRQNDVFRFAEELGTIDWSYQNLVFLDEVSFDSRGMLRKRGYAIKGQKLSFRGEFDRKPRVSLLCFTDVTGVSGVYDAVGTFDRHAFVTCCAVQAKTCASYPGKGSVWILDGASIHCHADIVNFLRSLGIVPIFLPAYCPFYNPIEYVFGLVKKAFRRQYKENATRDLLVFILGVMQQFKAYDMAGIYQHCGYTRQGRFDHSKQLNGTYSARNAAPTSDALLGFTDCDDESSSAVDANE